MGQPAVRFENVSKRFLLDRDVNRTLMEIFVRPFRRRSREYFWPLRDVSFELGQGSSLGLIGENGSGKSTILKLIARILEPTGGNVFRQGRIAALLELGASFHPELTGRENIFLSASIANVSQAEIRREIDEVIAFADIGPYIDVPVKHYSSGMYVRLGFSVAVRLHPEILLVDEVLAVGDEAFQHKCLQTIKHLRRQGITVVLVSHSMEQIADMCDTALWLHDGYVRSFGSPVNVIADYLALTSEQEQAEHLAGWAGVTDGQRDSGAGSAGAKPSIRYERGAPTPDARRWGDGAVVIREAYLLRGDGRQAMTFHPDHLMRLTFDYEVRSLPPKPLAFGIAIYRSDRVWCYGTNTAIEGIYFPIDRMPSSGTVTVDVPTLQLLQGDYTVDIAVHAQDGDITHDYVREAVRFYVKNPRGDSGVFRPQVHWSFKSPEEKESR